MTPTTTVRPAGLPVPAGPHHQPPTGAGAAPGPAVPVGAARMQPWFIDRDGRRVRTSTPVPVDLDDYRTAHVLHTCPRSPAAAIGVNGCGQHAWLLPGTSRFCPEHGVALAAVHSGSRRRLLVREYLRLHGRSTAPWALLGATTAVGVWVQVAAIPVAAVAGAVPVVAGVVYLGARVWITRREVKAGRIEKGQRDGRKIRRILRAARRAGLVVLTIGGWVVLAAALGPHNPAAPALWAALAAGWAVGSYPWWARAEQRRQLAAAPAAAPAAVEVAVPVVDPVQVRAVTVWRNHIGKPGGPLAGTDLVDFHRLPGCQAGSAGRVRQPNWTATVRATDPGSINMRELRPSLVGRIAAAYGCTVADVSFAADESDLSLAYLRVQPDNVLAEVRGYRGPGEANDWTKARTIVGRFEDGTPMLYQWWTELGAVHDLFSGCTGSGKSELVALLISASLHSHGRVLDWLGDPQGGQSYGVLKDVVDYFARDKTEIMFMLLAATKEMLRRNDTLAASNQKTWRPSLEMPLLVITLDEVQAYLDDPVVLEMVEKLVGMGRKCGIKMRLITQVPYAYALGGSIYIKEQLMAGQAFTFRAATQTAGRAAAEGDSPIDPTMLPERWGKSTCNPGHTTAGLTFVQGVHGRDIYGRGDFTGPDMNLWLYGPDGQPTMTPGQFSTAAQAVSGVLWGGREARRQAALALGRSDADLLRNGKALDIIATAAELAGHPNPSPDNPTGRPALAAGRTDGAGAKDIVYTAARKAAGEHPDGHADRKTIQALTPGMGTSTRDKAIGDLIAAGLLTRIDVNGRPRNGIFTLPSHPADPVVGDAA